MVKEKRYLKTLMMGLTICCALLISGIKVNAQTVNETEPNDTKETAQLIQANYETADQAVSGVRPGQYVVKGYASTTNEDWFKVYLTAGRQYVTCSDESFNFDVYDSNDTLIRSQLYTRIGFNVRAYAFQALTTGYYYVRVRGLTSSPSSYLLLVGGPNYKVQNCTIIMQSITMSGGIDDVENFNLSQQANLPDDAVVYTMLINNVRSTDVKSISIRNIATGNTLIFSIYPWYKDGIVSQNLLVKSGWQVIFRYKKDITFRPSLTLYYAYPLISEEAENVTITL